MKWTELPPLNSLKAFAALAEAGNYKGAGRLLSVTHAAVSQQVRLLEERLGTTLVIPDGRGSKLTADGLALARELQTGFAVLGNAVERTVSAGAVHPVQLSTSPAFATEWLMPRIQEFQSAHPDIPLLLNPTAKLVDLVPGEVEVAIRYRDRHRLLHPVSTVLVSDMVVVAAPSLLGDMKVLEPAMLVDLPWLQELNTNEVEDWFTFHAVTLTEQPKVTQMPGNLIMQAVRRGDAVTYTARAFFEEDLRSGAMVELFSDSAIGHYCIETCSPPLRKSTQALVDWLESVSQVCVSG